MSRYDAGNSQGAFQPNSNDKVLSNKLGLIDPVDMDEAELVLLEKLYTHVLIENLPSQKITINNLKFWHYQWLGNIYGWAGAERSVNMSKADFHFAVAAQIPKLLLKFEKDYLNNYTPCMKFTDEQLIEAIAIVHIEFILIHPFREGNGRLSRLLADVMAVQAGHEPLDYTSWDANKNNYFSAIQQGVMMNYDPMKAWVRKGLSNV